MSEKRPFVPKTPTDFQKMKLERLMANPEKPIFIPETPKERKGFTVPEFVRNVMGSSAGAGSGEFHVYRHLRRKEYTRQKMIEEKGSKEKLDEEFQKKLEENKRKMEEKTAKKRAKRLKKKEIKKFLKKNKQFKKDTKEGKNESTSESEEEEEDSDEQLNSPDCEQMPTNVTEAEKSKVCSEEMKKESNSESEDNEESREQLNSPDCEQSPENSSSENISENK